MFFFKCKRGSQQIHWWVRMCVHEARGDDDAAALLRIIDHIHRVHIDFGPVRSREYIFDNPPTDKNRHLCSDIEVISHAHRNDKRTPMDQDDFRWLSSLQHGIST